MDRWGDLAFYVFKMAATVFMAAFVVGFLIDRISLAATVYVRVKAQIQADTYRSAMENIKAQNDAQFLRFIEQLRQITSEAISQVAAAAAQAAAAHGAPIDRN